MAKYPSELSWSLIQSFLAVANTGSLSKAAASLNQSQPTLGRHIRALEDELGVELFERHRRGLRLTEAGELVRPLAEEMRQTMTQLTLVAEAESDRVEGTVRIAASVFAAHHVLPAIISEIRRKEPRISLVLQPSDDSDNLTFREADLAVRMYRPTQLELVTRHLGDLKMGVFAAKSYAERRSLPETTDDFLNHDIVGYDQNTLIVDTMQAMGFKIGPNDFSVRCDSHTAYWELVKAGAGIGFTQAHLGRADPSVVEIHPPGIVMPSLPVWLTAHENVRRVPRVDRIWTLLAEELSTFLRGIHEG